MPNVNTDPAEVRKRIAQQVTRDYNDMRRNGEIVSGPLLPEPTILPDPTQAAAPTPEKPPAPAPTAAPEPEPEGPVFGKYKDLDEAQKGYFSILKQTRDVQAENAKLKERIERLEQSPPPQPPNQTPPSPKAHPSAVHDWMKQDAVVKLAESTGIEPASLAELAQAIYSQAAQSAEAKVEERLTPILAQAQAQAEFNALHPEANRLQAEIDLYVASLPEDQKDVLRALGQVGRVKQAMEYVWTGFQQQMQAAAQNDMKANSKDAETKRTTQRAAASLPQQSPSTPIHAATEDTPDPKMMAELTERARQNDQNAQVLLRRLTFGRHLPPQLRTWER